MVVSLRPNPRFADRAEAGRSLAPLLVARDFADPVVYALPRGGVPVALPIAHALHAPLDLLLVRKLGVPWQPELGFGAIAEGLEEPSLNQDIIAHTGLTEDMIAPVLAAEKQQPASRRALGLLRYASGARRAWCSPCPSPRPKASRNSKAWRMR
jgi:predicted phosphoribosyltransferase